MATPLDKVYQAFLSKVEADDWMITEYWDEVRKDWRMLLNSAIMEFRYPRVSLDYDSTTETFYDELTNDEVQVLSSLMKLQWVKRCVATWDNIRQLYNSRDFSQANFLDKLNKTQTQIEDECRHLLDLYGRSANYKPNKIFSKLAGK